MKSIYLLIVCAGLLLPWAGHTRHKYPAHAAAVKELPLTIRITNPSGIARNEEVVEIPYTQLAGKLNGIKAFRLVNVETGKEVPYQLAYAGSEQPQQLLLLLSVPAHGTVTVKAVAGSPAPVKARAFGRFVPERKDDFAWENDRIAFRMYGAALENFPRENAHGIDVWTKRTSELVVNTWYKVDNYHHDNGQGLDYYKVGMTLGAGDIAPYLHDSICYSRNYTKWKVLDNGPLRTTFQLGYDAWQAGGITVSVVKTISLDAGSQLNKMSIVYSFKEAGSLPVAVGIVKRPEPGTMLLDEKTGVMGYWEPEHGADGITGLGCILPAGPGGLQVKHGHLLGTAAAKPGQPFVYYAGAAWNKAGRFTSAAEWFGYLQAFAQKLRQPLNISIQ